MWCDVEMWTPRLGSTQRTFFFFFFFFPSVHMYPGELNQTMCPHFHITPHHTAPHHPTNRVVRCPAYSAGSGFFMRPNSCATPVQPGQFPYCVCRMSCGRSSYSMKKPMVPPC